MNKNKLQPDNLNTIALMAVFATLAVALISLVLAGASAYRKTVERDDSSFYSRTVSRYFNSVIQDAVGKEIYIESFGKGEAMCIRDESEDKVYIIKIYSDGEYLRELYTQENSGASAESGEKLLKCSSLEFTYIGNLITIKADIPSKGVQTMYFCHEAEKDLNE